MKVIVSKEELIEEFKRFLIWETRPFDFLESVEIFVAETLSEAWVLARPNDEYKFRDNDFKTMVDKSVGKWLEKQSEDDSYKIILSTRYCDSLQDLTKTLVHEMRHCLDYQKAVEDLAFEDYYAGKNYYINWSEFRAVYAHTRYKYFVKQRENMSKGEKFKILAGILGEESADAVMGLFYAEDLRETMYYISRYIGASRAIRDLNGEEGVNASAFELWHMTPQYINENFGYVFYVGNEWNETNVCRLDKVPKSRYYGELVEKIIAKIG